MHNYNILIFTSILSFYELGRTLQETCPTSNAVMHASPAVFIKESVNLLKFWTECNKR